MRSIYRLVRALVVDDYAPARSGFRRLLVRLGFDVVEAVNGEEALQLLAHTSFDLAVIDWKLTGIDGIAVVEQVRREARFDDMKIIMVSAVEDERSPRPLEAGADAYIAKSTDRRKLVQLLQRLGVLTPTS